MVIGFLIQEELRNKIFLLTLAISVIVFLSYAVISANSYRELIEESNKASEESVLDWKTVEEHNLGLLAEKKDLLEKERDRIKLQNNMEVIRYRLDNNIEPKTDFNTVKGFIEYNYSNNMNILYMATIIILFVSASVSFDRTSFYYMEAFGYKKIFFSKILSGIIFAIVIWILNFIIMYIVGLKNFGPFSGNAINFVDGAIVLSGWKSSLFKMFLLSLTYPVFSSLIPMTVTSIVRNRMASLMISILIYFGVVILKLGVIFPIKIAEYSFIGNMYMMKPVNGVPDLYMNGMAKASFINIFWIALFIAIAFFSYRRFVHKNYKGKLKQDEGEEIAVNFS